LASALNFGVYLDLPMSVALLCQNHLISDVKTVKHHTLDLNWLH